jgi:hypothetical protein
MACEIKRFGIQEPKGWDGVQTHPILQETDSNYIETPYYDSENEDDDDENTECETNDGYQDTDSDYQSSDENIIIRKYRNFKKRTAGNYKIILADETDYIPE